MKRHARRMTTGAAVLGVGILVVLVINWDAVCGHIQAWRFQLGNKTTMILPQPATKGLEYVLAGKAFNAERSSRFELPVIMSLLANHSGTPVIYNSMEPIFYNSPLPPGAWWTEAPTPSPRFVVSPTEIKAATADLAIRILRANGWRVIDQRFPDAAYIVFRIEPTAAQIDPVWRGGITLTR